MEEKVEHALIIGENRRSMDILEESLWDAGYHSIVAVRDAKEAWKVLRALRPNLIVVTADALSSSSTHDLYLMSEKADAPIIVATADPRVALHCLGPNVSLDGPYDLHAVADARIAAMSLSPGLAHAA